MNSKYTLQFPPSKTSSSYQYVVNYKYNCFLLLATHRSETREREGYYREMTRGCQGDWTGDPRDRGGLRARASRGHAGMCARDMPSARGNRATPLETNDSGEVSGARHPGVISDKKIRELRNVILCVSFVFCMHIDTINSMKYRLLRGPSVVKSQGSLDPFPVFAFSF